MQPSDLHHGPTVWCGLMGMTSVEGNFVLSSDGLHLNYTHWSLREPNSSPTADDCIVMIYPNRGCADFGCLETRLCVKSHFEVFEYSDTCNIVKI